MGRVRVSRRRVWEVLEHGRAGDRAARLAHAAIVALILINIGVVILETVPSYAARFGLLFIIVEVISVAAFAFEYAVRLWVAPEHPVYRGMSARRARRSYALSVGALIDLMAILPFVLAMVVPADLRVLVMFRLLRFLKLARYSPGLQSLMDALVAERRALFGCMVIGLGLVLIFASLMHLVESSAQPDKFGTLPDAMWWAVVTLATVGYGDVIPITPFGKLVASGAIMCSIVLMALPIGIIATAFAEQIHRRDFVVTWGMVARVPLFAELDASEIADVMRLLRAQALDAGAIICRRGDPAHSMYFIAAGEVEIEFPNEKRRLGEGTFFGEVAVLSRSRRSATVTALTRSSLLILNASDLHNLMERKPAIAKRVREVADARVQQLRISPRGDMTDQEVRESSAVDTGD